MLERPILVLDCTIFGAGSSGFGAGNLVLERAFLVLDRGLSKPLLPPKPDNKRSKIQLYTLYFDFMILFDVNNFSL